MSKLNQNLSDILDIDFQEDSEYSQELTTNKTSEVSEINEVSEVAPESIVDKDSEFVRVNIKSLVGKGERAIDELAEIARSSQHPRAYEVLSGLIKNVSDLNKDLMKIHKDKRELSGKSSDINVDKAVVFTGTTKDFLKMIKETKKEE